MKDVNDLLQKIMRNSELIGKWNQLINNFDYSDTQKLMVKNNIKMFEDERDKWIK